MKRYYKQINVLKGIAIFLVILGHSIIVFPINIHENPFYGHIYELSYSISMPLFFLISGYCYSNKGNYLSFIKKKFNRLMIPYFIFSFITVIAKFFGSVLVNTKINIFEDTLAILFYGGGYWFLYSLFVCFLIFPLFERIIKESYLKQIVLFVLCCFAGLFCKTNLFSLLAVSKYMPYFALGYFIRNNHSSLLTKKTKNPILCFIPLFILWNLLLLTNNNLLQKTVPVIGIICVYFLSQIQIVELLFEDIGNYTLQLYILNGYFLVFSRTVIINVLKVTNPTAIVLFNLFVDLYISYYIIEYIIMRIKISDFVFGNY